MKNINDIMPKLPLHSLGLVMNWNPKKSELNNLVTRSPLPFDSKWHTVEKIPGINSLVIDNKEIRQRTSESMT